jgi:hypothetical protein
MRKFSTHASPKCQRTSIYEDECLRAKGYKIFLRPPRGEPIWQGPDHRLIKHSEAVTRELGEKLA